MAGPRLTLIVDRARRAGLSPFDALVAAADEDPQAAEGLALGYAALDRDERERLVAALVHDAQASGRSPASTLALLLSVEEDPSLAREIAAALIDAGFGEDAADRERAEGGAGRTAGSAGQPTERDVGWAWGALDEGGVAVARHLDGAFVEVTCLRWRGGELEPPRVEPIARDERLESVRRRIGVPDSADLLAFDDALDRLAAQLWRLRRTRGSLPERLAAIAHLFAVPYRSPLG